MTLGTLILIIVILIILGIIIKEGIPYFKQETLMAVVRGLLLYITAATIAVIIVIAFIYVLDFLMINWNKILF